MATVITAPVPLITYQPYAGIADVDAVVTSIPRGHVEVSTFGAAIALSGAGDNQLLRMSVSLPVNFAYAMVDIMASIQASAGLLVDFEDDALMRLEDGLLTARTVIYDLQMTATGVGTIGSGPLGIKVYAPVHSVPNLIIKPSGPTQPVSFLFQVFNPNVEDIAYTFNFYAKFLRFDIDQTLHFGVNAPVPVR